MDFTAHFRQPSRFEIVLPRRESFEWECRGHNIKLYRDTSKRQVRYSQFVIQVGILSEDTIVEFPFVTNFVLWVIFFNTHLRLYEQVSMTSIWGTH